MGRFRRFEARWLLEGYPRCPTQRGTQHRCRLPHNCNNWAVYRPAECGVTLDVKRKPVAQLHRHARPGI
jgi:hypothetical protein